MKIDTKVLGKVGTNCYVLMNEDTKEIIIVDPADWEEDIETMVEQFGGKPVGILLTHGHFDHITAADAVRENYQIKMYANEAEKDTLKDSKMNMSGMGTGPRSYTADVFLKDGERFELAGFSIQMLSTPGHTPGGACFYFEKEKVLFSGDTLFADSVGRSDFPGGSMSALVRSIQEKLLNLPDEVIVYPGHMGATTIGHERQYNPFLG
ncbi:MAG: MBL fold metallo-hydrolase [Lachnospiraceae bacterium]